MQPITSEGEKSGRVAMINKLKYRGVRFRTNHSLRSNGCHAVAKLQDLPYPLTISTSTIPELRQGKQVFWIVTGIERVNR